MMKSFLYPLLLLICIRSEAQSLKQIITAAEVQNIESVLSADSMQGRKAFTQGAERTADFISKKFGQIGLFTFKDASGFKQTFTMRSTMPGSISGTIDGAAIDSKNIIPFTTFTELNITEKSSYTKKYITSRDQLRSTIGEYLKLKENLLVFVDSSLSQTFYRLNSLRQQLFPSEKSVVFVLASGGNNFEINIKQEIKEVQGSNVVGVIPGKSKKEEVVIFSAHYDHIGIEKGKGPDTIYNGANDDASGVTAVIEMAKYFKAVNNNERTLLFAAFTAEEMGGYGSQYFSRQLDPDKVVAMFNIEMIGTESKWGKNSAFITGFEKSDLGQILQRNLKGTDFKFYPDPYTDLNLFYRSDNATLARLGVPAHTISTSKMDNEANYHKVTDELKTLDISNMTEIIKAVIMSAESIVNGKDLPTRVKADELTR